MVSTPVEFRECEIHLPAMILPDLSYPVNPHALTFGHNSWGGVSPSQAAIWGGRAPCSSR